MNHSIKTGLSFGLTSSIITTLGLMVGLHSGTHSKLVVLGGLLTIAIADAFSDALGIHISEEFETKHTGREVWESTFTTFFAKFVFPLTFVVPVLVLDITTAIKISVIWGLGVLGIISFWLARETEAPTGLVVGEHLSIAVLVIVITHFAGDWISSAMG
jgi:VIT1/CCC1 family predicted Fe2+/Mn2+ transporter